MCNNAGKRINLISVPVGIDGENITLKAVKNENFCDFSEQKRIIQWMDNVGIIVYKKSRKKDFSVIGSLFILSHAYIEQATTESGRKVGYQTNNWWNFGALKCKGQKVCKGVSRFACFNNLDEAYEAYYDRITSKEDLIAYKNENFNPSYPLLGKLFKKDEVPSEKDINEATRILINGKQGSFIYCGDDNKLRYARELRNCAKTAKKDMLVYLERKIKCLEQQESQKEETKEKPNFFLFTSPLSYKEQNETPPSEKEDLEKIKVEIETYGNV